ncbi:hypothetical protein OH77DRAFT_1239121 [Trametes cingulata]|nr:hypothetical protein OH77DRAFT_1239121 [Trametes cingulata]
MPIKVNALAPVNPPEIGVAASRPASTDPSSGHPLRVPRAKSPPEDDVAEEDRHDGSTVVDGSDIGHLPPQPSCHRSANIVRLVPTNGFSRSSPLRMECVLRGSGEFQLFGPWDAEDDGEAHGLHASMDEILWKYSGQIVSLSLDASSLPSPKSEQVMVQPFELPFSSWVVASQGHPSGFPGSMHLFPELTELTITTNRKISHRSLLTLLHATPMLRTLSVRNSVLYQHVMPEDNVDLPKVNLPYLQNVLLKGFFAGAVDEVLSMLTLNGTTRVEVYLSPAFPSQTIGALRSFLAAIRHARLSYTALRRCGDAGADRYLFTFSDVDSRIQVHWDWEASAGDPASLFHVTLDAGAALAKVRQLTISLRGVAPSFLDWVTVLKPFPSLRHVDLHVTPPDPLGPIACGGSRTATFLVRAAPLLKKVADVPLMFALGLA